MGEFPSGTVTFLFTDVEGSTALLDNLREEYADVLAAHRRLLRSSVTAAGGREVDTQGDAFFFAFPRAVDAMVAAANAQRALAGHRWPAGVRVRVRMGVHTGEPEVSDGGFVGLPVHRAARICGVARGGDVLCSTTTRDLVEHQLPPGLALGDAGECRLKDFARPERLHVLLIEGLSRGDTAAAVRVAGSLPFVGREDELAVAALAALRPRRGARRDRWRAALLEQVGRRPAAVWLASLRVEALRPSLLVLTPPLVAGGIAFHPALIGVVPAVFGARYAARMRRLTFARGIEGSGFRVCGMGWIASDSDLRIEVGRLGGSLIKGGRLMRDASRLIRAVDRRGLHRQLHELRCSDAPTEDDLERADVVARQILAVGALKERNAEFEDETMQVDRSLPALRERIFETRLDAALAAPLAREIASVRERVDALAADLGDAYDELIRLIPVHERRLQPRLLAQRRRRDRARLEVDPVERLLDTKNRAWLGDR